MRAALLSVLFAVCLAGDVPGEAARAAPAAFGMTIDVWPEPANLSPSEWGARVAAARARYEAFAARALAHARNSAARRPGNSALPPAILHDPTLRRNDLYVGKSTVFIFSGAPAAHHAPRDFVPLKPTRIRALGIRIGGAR